MTNDDHSEENSKDQAFKVRDLRRFDSSGNEKGDEEKAVERKVFSSPPENVPEQQIEKRVASAGEAPAQKAPAAKKVMAKEEAAISPESLEGAFEESEGELNFSSFVISLATQALMQLGQVPPPPGVQIEVDPIAAKQTIDLLGILEKKTQGNLTPDEQRLLDEVLLNLRMGFVRISK